MRAKISAHVDFADLDHICYANGDLTGTAVSWFFFGRSKNMSKKLSKFSSYILSKFAGKSTKFSKANHG